MSGSRLEKDSFGEIEVPADRLWGAQTERSLRFFRISSERMPLPVVHALARIKRAAAQVNAELGLLDARKGDAIQLAAREVLDGRHDEGCLARLEWRARGAQRIRHACHVGRRQHRRVRCPAGLRRAEAVNSFL